MLDARAVAGSQVMRMRALGRGRICVRGQSPVGLAGRSSGRGILESDGDFRLLLADNYSRTIKNITAETQSTRRTNERRRLLLRTSELFFQVLKNKQIERLCELCDSAVNNRKTF
jgi:hypothetical protein